MVEPRSLALLSSIISMCYLKLVSIKASLQEKGTDFVLDQLGDRCINRDKHYLGMYWFRPGYADSDQGWKLRFLEF